MAKDDFEELQARRTQSLAWLLGYGFALLDRLVVAEVRASGHPAFGGALATLTKAMPPAGEATIGELAARAGVTKQAMSQLVAKMQDLGHVRVRPDPTDGRARRVSYSRKGRALARAIVETALRYEALCGAELGERELARLRQGLAKVVAVLEREAFGRSGGVARTQRPSDAEAG